MLLLVKAHNPDCASGSFVAKCTLVLTWRPLVDLVIITGAKEEVRSTENVFPSRAFPSVIIAGAAVTKTTGSHSVFMRVATSHKTATKGEFIHSFSL